MVGEKHLRLDDLRCIHQLVDSHRVRLVTGQKGDVDVLDVGHLRNVLCVTGDIDTQTVEREDISIVTTLRMELCVAFRIIVCRHGFDLDVGGIYDAVAVFQWNAVAEHVIDSSIRIDAGGRCSYTGDGLAVEMILVLMGDEDDVGLGELIVVGCGLYAKAYRVNLDLCTVVVDFNTGMFDACECDLLATFSGEFVHFLSSLAASEYHYSCTH